MRNSAFVLRLTSKCHITLFGHLSQFHNDHFINFIMMLAFRYAKTGCIS